MCSTRQRLAALLREERSVMGLTLRQAAQRAQIAPSTLSRWEAGTCVPRVPELEALLGALEMPTESVRRILASLDAPRAARAIRAVTNADGEPPVLAPTGGMLLRALRHKAKLSLTEVAHRLHVAPSTVSRWEAAAAHPASELFEPLMDLLMASEAERQCLAASGVAKIKAPRRPFDAERVEAELRELDRSIPAGGAEGAELRLLELQSELWWTLEQPGAHALFRFAHIVYARLLLAEARYGEAMEQAQAALEIGTRWEDEFAVAAHRVLARADVYRWSSPRPHLGLYVLQPVLHSITESELRAPVLSEMAEYSLLAGRASESLGYAMRAHAVASTLPDGDLQLQADIALGLAYAAVGESARALEHLTPIPTDTTVGRARRLIATIEALRRMERSEEVGLRASEAETFIEAQGLSHLAPDLKRANEIPIVNVKTS
jgi:transcriptional regulator with XRE-family HTH domain